MLVLALASEERTRQMKVHSYRTPAPSSTSQDLERVLKNKREVTSPVFPHSALMAHLYMGFVLLTPAWDFFLLHFFSYLSLLQLYKEQRRSCDNVSHKSSDSDVSDVSAISRASSASRISSTSYMSIQSERPRGCFRSANHTETYTVKIVLFVPFIDNCCSQLKPNMYMMKTSCL